MCAVFPYGLQKAQWFVGFCWKPKVEPKSAHKPPTNGFVSGLNLEEQIGRDLMRRIVKRLKDQKGMFKPWNPTKQNIERWMTTKELEFAHKYNRNPKYTPLQYLERYIFTDLHEIFFYEFPHFQQEWIMRLKDRDRDRSGYHYHQRIQRYVEIETDRQRYVRSSIVIEVKVVVHELWSLLQSCQPQM